MLGLNGEQTPHALGIAASLSSGIGVNFGTMTKPLHVGRAAQNGIIAVHLASLGFTSDRNSLDAPWGYFQIFVGGFDKEKISGHMGLIRCEIKRRRDLDTGTHGSGSFESKAERRPLERTL